jgi:Arc/MetJ family transcription regulator
MRTNIDIDDALMDAAMKAGPFSTKKDAVEAGLRLLARQTAYRDILALRGQLRWEDATQLAGPFVVEQERVEIRAKPIKAAETSRSARASTSAATKAASASRTRRK